MRQLQLLVAVVVTALLVISCSQNSPVDLAEISGQAVPGQYIVVLNEAFAPGGHAANRARAAEVARGLGLSPFHTYGSAIFGFAAVVPEGRLNAIMRDPRVAYVEQDQVFTIVATETQTNATWGLDRIDQRNLPLNGTYTYEPTASNVHAYIIDTGIRYGHTDFEGRAVFGFDAFGGNGNDGNGHGTHVAGTVGGSTWGVAKGVKLYAVRVLDNSGSGTTSGVIAGVDWVTDNHTKPAVANMSLGGGASTALDDAVRASITAGVTYSVAAGNGNWLGRQQPACNYSPARVREALTVGATTTTDAKTSWSNYGECVDIFAPGASITSAWHISNTATNTISGTSMAAPHVAGVAALYLANNPGASPATVFSAIYDNSTKGIVTNSSTANNHLLYSLLDGGTPPPSNNPPTASFTYSCTDLTCDFTDTSTDPDGSIVGWSWAFGDSNTSTETNPSHTYGAGRIYTVTLTVADDDGATGSTSKSVTVNALDASGISLSVSGHKVRGLQTANLSWSGATSSSVDIYRDSNKVVTTDNSGSYTDNIDQRGGGSYTYRVCEANTSTCSSNVTVTF